MNLKGKEFWKLANEFNKGTKRFVNHEYHLASLGLEEHPLYGPGSNGGGRICICENCGAAEWTHSSSKQFCSRSCRSEYYSCNRTPDDSTIVRKRGNVVRRCSFCNKEFTIQMHRVKKGQGIYCSSTCANHARGLTPLWYRCNTCKSVFKAVTNMGSRYCCTQCQARKPNTDEEGNYYEAIPRLLNPDDKFDHMINLILEKHMRSAQQKARDIFKVTISPTLRMKAITNSMKRKASDYYLNKRDRDTLELMDLLVDEATEEYNKPISKT